MNYYLIGALVGAGAGYALSKKDRQKWALIGAGAGVAAGYLMTQFEGDDAGVPAEDMTVPNGDAGMTIAMPQFEAVTPTGAASSSAGGGGGVTYAAQQTYAAAAPQTKGVSAVTPKTFIGGGGAPAPATTVTPTSSGPLRTKAGTTILPQKKRVFSKTGTSGSGTTGRILTL